MKILMLGAGAIGGYFGGRLAEAGADVTFLVRPQRAAQLAKTGLVVESPSGNIHRPVQTVVREEVKADYDVVLLSCKSYDLDTAIASIEPAVGPQTAIIPLLNGLAHLDTLDRAFGAQRVLGGLCFTSVSLTPEGVIRHLNPMQRIAFGPRSGGHDERAAALLRAFQGTPVTATLSDRILQEMWDKFIFITTLAGMNCLMRGSVGDIVATQEGTALVLEMLDSCTQVATREGYPPAAAYLEQIRKPLTDQGSLLMASMLRDVEQGGRTEGDHIVGDMYRRAQREGVSAPLLRAALCHLQTYEARRRR